MSFDPQQFLDATFTEANDTQLAPIPPGEYLARIEEVEFVTGERKDGSGQWLKLHVRYSLEDPQLRESLGRIPVAFQDIFLDTKEDGTLDMGTGKNIRFGQLREATDLNRKGEAFNPRMFIGRQLIARVDQEIYKDRPISKVTGVTKPSNY